ncbi:MAG: FtsX-like permease family protein [Dolichospermum sp. DEX182a]|nr:FtsX-like permease family protein [Dolichospermum sp. DEX182a]
MKKSKPKKNNLKKIILRKLFYRSIPVYWLQLIHQKSRLIVSIVGVTFSVILIFTQLGLRDGMFEDSVTMHKTLAADIVVLPAETQNFWTIYARSFPRRVLYSISGIDGINSVSPFYLAWGHFKNPINFSNVNIAISAFNPNKPIFKLSEVNQQIDIIKQADTFLFDRFSRGEFGPIAKILENNDYLETELSNRKIKIKGLFSLGGGVFSADGMLITSDVNYAYIFNEKLEKVHLGLVTLKPGYDSKVIIKKISEKLSKGIAVMTIEELMKKEKIYWAKATPIGFIFNLLSVMSFIIGGIIVYQILYTQISDYLPAYATLKAIGYKDRYLIITVLKEALVMSILGYIPGLFLSYFIYSFLQNATRLPLFMTFSRICLVLFLTIFMCSIGSILAIFKLRSADPAELL